MSANYPSIAFTIIIPFNEDSNHPITHLNKSAWLAHAKKNSFLTLKAISLCCWSRKLVCPLHCCNLVHTAANVLCSQSFLNPFFNSTKLFALMTVHDNWIPQTENIVCEIVLKTCSGRFCSMNWSIEAAISWLHYTLDEISSYVKFPLPPCSLLPSITLHSAQLTSGSFSSPLRQILALLNVCKHLCSHAHKNREGTTHTEIRIFQHTGHHRDALDSPSRLKSVIDFNGSRAELILALWKIPPKGFSDIESAWGRLTAGLSTNGEWRSCLY